MSPGPRSLLLGALFTLPAAAVLAQTGSTATVSVLGGPFKGEYGFAPTEACVIASFGKRPLGISVVLHSADSSLSIDMPSIDDQHANQIQVVLVIADAHAGGGKGTSSVTYEIDTRPDSSLEQLQRAERANKGMTGKATTTIMQKGDSVLLSFTGQTADGVKLDGSVTCRKVV
jgi:hypothetical protein